MEEVLSNLAHDATSNKAKSVRDACISATGKLHAMWTKSKKICREKEALICLVFAFFRWFVHQQKWNEKSTTTWAQVRVKSHSVDDLYGLLRVGNEHRHTITPCLKMNRWSFLREKCFLPLKLALESRSSKLSLHAINGLQVCALVIFF